MNRKIDDMGRIVIPKEMRKKLELNNGEEAHIELIGDEIIITNPNSFNLKKYIEEQIKLCPTQNYNNGHYQALNNILNKIK